MRFRILFPALLSSLLYIPTTNVNAAEELPIPEDQFVYCSTCHGVQLMGNEILQAPRLSGMDAWYVEQQLQSFKKGWRGKHESDLIGMEMRPMAEALSDEQISEVAGYVSLTRSAPPVTTLTGNIEEGRALYESTCSACHGLSGEGNEVLGSPALSATNDWYLLKQLQGFIDGSRGEHPEDIFGLQMRVSVQLLSDDDMLLNVVNYIVTLRDN
jgi:cbb3-type cytochrome c oxidase subunit III